MNALQLRVRPSNIRYFILCVSNDNAYTTTTHKGLSLALGRGTKLLMVADLKNNTVIKVSKPKKFLSWWAENYDNVTDDIPKEVRDEG